MKSLNQATSSFLKLTLTELQIEQFQIYLRLLVEWNTRVNLTSITTTEEIIHKHFLDSLSCLQVITPTMGAKLVDIGSGAGFPGLPIKIATPELKVTIVESVGKKVNFCLEVVKQLGLQGVEVITTRAEEIGQRAEFREQFDWAVARAVANLPILVEYLLPLVKVKGSAIAQKGITGPAETQKAEFAIRMLGGEVRKLIPIHLPGIAEDRFLVVIDKTAQTPPAYPRRVGIPAKRPLIIKD